VDTTSGSLWVSMKGFVDLRRNGFGNTGSGKEGGVEGTELAAMGGLGGGLGGLGGGLGGLGAGTEGTGGIVCASSPVSRSWLAGVKVASKKLRFILGVTGESARS